MPGAIDPWTRAWQDHEGGGADSCQGQSHCAGAASSEVRGREGPATDTWVKPVPGRESSKCKGPEAGALLQLGGQCGWQGHRP